MADKAEKDLDQASDCDFIRALKGTESVSISKDLFIAMIDKYAKYIHLIPKPSDFDTADIGYSIVDEHILHKPSDNLDYGNIGIVLTLKESVYGVQLFFAFIDSSMYFRVKYSATWNMWEKVTCLSID